MAATRRGCVQPTMPRDVRPISAMYCVICVVLPEPVSPMTTRHWWSRIAPTSSSRSVAIGRPARCSRMLLLDTWPKDRAAFFCWAFQALSTCEPAKLTDRSSCAKWRSPASGSGSSQGRLRSLGMPSMRALAWACFSSRRSLASAPCVSAARWSDPSGLATILTGDASRAVDVWPRRKAGSTSLSSISTSSSTSSRWSPSASKPGINSGGSTPEAASWRASKSSGEVRRLAARRGAPRLSRSLARRSSSETPGLIIGLDRWRRASARASASSPRSSARRGCRSRPVLWSHSFIDSEMRWPARPTTFTKTRWPRDTTEPTSRTRAFWSMDTCTRPSRLGVTPWISTKQPNSAIFCTLPS
mmetsp:Transcript_3212/g.9436  ORF Transcript_3212/g.9436 Transcript_3212/m.9436 type:complete len:358 (-) Transcript_3212:112-1185(-)